MKSINEILIEGVEATYSNNLEEAEQIFTEALTVYKDSHIILYNLGIVFLKKEKFKEASDIFEKALLINSSDPDIWTDAGLAYQELGNTEKALNCYNKALENAEDKSLIYNNIGTLYFSEENYKEAKACFKKSSFREQQLYKRTAESGISKYLSRCNFIIICSMLKHGLYRHFYNKVPDAGTAPRITRLIRE